MNQLRAGDMTFWGHKNLTLDERINIRGLFALKGLSIGMYGKTITLQTVLDWLYRSCGYRHFSLWSNKFKGRTVQNWSEPRTSGNNWHGKQDRRLMK